MADICNCMLARISAIEASVGGPEGGVVLASAQWAAAPGRLAGTVQPRPVRSRAGPGRPLLGRWAAAGGRPSRGGAQSGGVERRDGDASEAA